jgi:5-methylcytosine-specific restriction endonuclease McrA
MPTLSADVLVLNANYKPYDLVDLKKAWDMLEREAAYVLTAYADKVLRSATDTYPWPAVIVLKRFQGASRRVKFSRANVFARDSYTCQYCGAKPTRHGLPDRTALTYDHVVPQSRSVKGRVVARGRQVSVTGWDNIVTCCYDCNQLKSDRTPTEAKMPLRFWPRRPNAVATVLLRLRQADIPEEWKEHLPEGSPWSD